MGLTWTLIILTVTAAFAGFARYMESRPLPPDRIKMVPWTSLLLICVFVIVLMLVHLANLAGIETGQRTRM